MYNTTTFILSKKALKAVEATMMYWIGLAMEPLSRSGNGNGNGSKEADDSYHFVGNSPLCRMCWADGCGKCPYMRKHGFNCEDPVSPYAKYIKNPTLNNARIMAKSLEDIRK